MPDSQAEVPAVWRVGDVIDGRYEVRRVHEGGGMGLVYRVRHLSWGTDLAVKSPRPEKFRSEGQRKLFTAEAQAWVSLGLHPHVCCCYYVRTLGGIPRAFAEYVDGGSLRDWIDDGRLYRGDRRETEARILDIAIQFAWGLGHAHGNGMVHQDVKPANVLIERAGETVTAKVSDFGMARARALAATAGDGGGAAAGGSVRAGASMLVSVGGWTKAYCSPEQGAGQPVGRRTDVYSFAVSVLEMFTGGVTWMAGPAAPDALADVQRRGAGGDGLPVMPAGLAALLQRCLSQDPAQRPGSMAEVAAGLCSIFGQETGREYPRTVPVAAESRADQLNNRALSLLDLGQPAEAEQAFAQALQADPRHLEATYNGGLARWRRGAITDEDVITSLEAVRAETGDPWQARLLLAHTHLERGDLATAQALLDRLAAEQPGEPEVQAALQAVRSGQITGACCVEAHSVRRSDHICFTPDGRLALNGGSDGTVRLWDVPSGQCRQAFTGHGEYVCAVAITADGRFAVSSGRDWTVRVWDLSAGCSRHVFRAVPAPDRLAGPVWIGTDPGLVLWTDSSHRVFVSDLVSGQQRLTLSHDYLSVSAVTVSADGRRALTGYGSEARLWDLVSGRCLKVLRCRSDTLTLSADGRFAATGSRSGLNPEIMIWDLATGRNIRTLTGHEGGVRALSLNADASFLLSGGHRGVRLWDVNSGRCLRTYPVPGVSALHLDAGTRFGVTAGPGVPAGQGTVLQRWSLLGTGGSGHAGPPMLSRPCSPAERGRLDAQAQALLAGATEAMAAGRYVSALGQLARVRTIPGFEREPEAAAAWRELGRRCVRAGLRGVWPVRALTGANASACDLEADGRFAVTGHLLGEVRLWDLDSGTCVRAVPAHRAGVRSVALSPAGGRFLSACADPQTMTLREQGDPPGSCYLWAYSGDRLREFPVRDAREVRFTADGRRALSASNDGTIRLWELDTGRCRHQMRADSEWVRIWAGADGRYAVSGGFDGVVRLWDLEAGQCVRELRGHTGGVLSVCLSADGRYVLSCGNWSDPTIRLWDAGTGDCMRVLGGIGGLTTVVRFTTDGRFALTGSHDGLIRVWDAGSGACLLTVEAHKDPISELALSSDGCLLMSSGRDGVRLWHLDWELAAREPADWDDGAAPHLRAFLALHRPGWTAGDFERLLRRLQDTGYGWLRADGVRTQLDRMAGPDRTLPPKRSRIGRMRRG